MTDAATALRTAGAEAVVVSLGADGLLAVTGDGDWHASPPARVAGNATGAGDAVTAALVHGMVSSRPWPERLGHAMALGAAAVAAPVAGSSAAPATSKDCARWRYAWRRWLMTLAVMSEIIRPAGPQATVSGRSTSSASSTPRRSSPAPRPPPPRWCCRSARTASPTTAPSRPSPAPAWRSRARPRCRWPCTWTTRRARNWSRPRPSWACAPSCTTRPGSPTPQRPLHRRSRALVPRAGDLGRGGAR